LSSHLFFKTASGDIVGIGDNIYGSLGPGTFFLSFSVLINKGVTSASSTEFTSLPLPFELQAMASGWNHTLALSKDGSVYSWGKNEEGQLGTGDYDQCSVPQKIPLPNGLRAVHVACGRDSSYIVAEDGSAFSCGQSGRGQLGYPTEENPSSLRKIPLEGITYIWAGRDHVFARTQENKIYAWGQCGFDEDVMEYPTEKKYPKFVEFICGGNHNLGLDDEGHVWSFGRNQADQLGRITENARASFVPVKIPNLENVVTAAGGLYHSLVLTKSGKVFGWGRNISGQVGVTKTKEVKIPQEVIFPTSHPIVFILCGNHYSAVIDSCGSLFFCGTVFAMEEKKIDPLHEFREKFSLPQPVDLSEKWNRIFRWLFLGTKDHESDFSEFPIEVLFAVALVVGHRTMFFAEFSPGWK
jgi:alpha-tubulin suppressor-like RCC1 family protein